MPGVRRLSLLLGLSSWRARRQAAMRILMFHGVGDDPYPAKAFERDLRYLTRRFKVVPLDHVLGKLASGDEPDGDEVALTFDDGLRNNATVAAPILERFGAPATFFVCPGLIERGDWSWVHEARERLGGLSGRRLSELGSSLGQPPRSASAAVEWMKTLAPRERRAAEESIRAATAGFEPTGGQHLACDVMTWEDLRGLDPELITVGSHTVNHEILTTLGPDAAEREIRESRRWLEERLGRPVEHFAFPNGGFDSSLLALVRACYRSAVTTVPDLIRPTQDAHCLPRIPAGGGADLPLLAWRLHRPGA